MSVRLQSSFHLSGVLERFAETGEIDPFEESYGGIHLRVSRSSEGVEISDGEIRAGMNGREARKWAAVIIGELERFRACQTERSRIRTVFADGQNGRWVLQWGDEVFAPFEMIETIKTGQGSALPDRSRRVVSKRAEGLLIILDQATGGCVALDEPESASLFLHRLNGQDLQD